jgi:hypothetical protein
MADRTLYDKRLETVKQRLQNQLVDEQGHPAKPRDIASVVDAKAESLAEAPVQEFIPLLIERQARDELRQHGLCPDLRDETSDPASAEAAQDQPDGLDPRTDSVDDRDELSPLPK